MKRIPSSQKTRQAIRALFEQGINEGDPKSELTRMAMRLIAEEALEAPKVFSMPSGEHDQIQHRAKVEGEISPFGQKYIGESQVFGRLAILYPQLALTKPRFATMFSCRAKKTAGKRSLAF